MSVKDYEVKFINQEYIGEILMSGRCIIDGTVSSTFRLRNVSDEKAYSHEINVKLISPKGKILCSKTKYEARKKVGKISEKEELAYKAGRAVESLYAEKSAYLTLVTEGEEKKKRPKQTKQSRTL